MDIATSSTIGTLAPGISPGRQTQEPMCRRAWRAVCMACKHAAGLQ